MNKKRISKTIIFLTIGAIAFVPLFFIKDIIALFVDEKNINDLRKLELAHKITNTKAFFIIFGIIFLMVGIYQLIMLFTEEESKNNE